MRAQTIKDYEIRFRKETSDRELLMDVRSERYRIKGSNKLISNGKYDNVNSNENTIEPQNEQLYSSR